MLLNQTPYNSTVKESINLQIDLGIRTDRQSAWRTINGGSWRGTGGRNQDHPHERKMKKGKIVVRALQIAEKRREAKGNGEK